MSKKNMSVRAISEGDQEYLQDESKFSGTAASVSFPKDIEEIKETLRECVQNKAEITVQGARTGITGACVPVGGHILNMKNMNRILEFCSADETRIKAEGGVTVQQLEAEIRNRTSDSLFFPAVPTEKTATIGGMAASGSGGIYTYAYGDFKDYVEEIEVLDYLGEVHKITKGDPRLYEILGSEGMTGIILTLTLRLVKKPEFQWWLLFFFENDDQACAFADMIVGLPLVAVIEYMDGNTVSLIEKYKKNMSAISDFPDIPENMSALIYIELFADSEDEIEEASMELIEKCEEAGADSDLIWAIASQREAERLKAFRHAASECVNMEVAAAHNICREITKISADILWKEKSRSLILKDYKESLKAAGLKYCIFGHMGTKNPYVNIMADDLDDYLKGRELLMSWEKEAYMEGGQIFTEHGVGKLKIKDYNFVVQKEVVREALRINQKWDPLNLFNPGNKFSCEK